jgi:hypothetical protein
MRWKSAASPEPDRPPNEFARQALADLTEAIQGLVSALTPATESRVLTYDDAIGWFVDHRPPAATAAGAILRSPAPGGRTEIMQVFLTDDHQIAANSKNVPYGRRFVVDRIDQELADSFGDTALLIVN